MDIKGIKKVIELMKENELSEFELAEEGIAELRQLTALQVEAR